MSVLFLFFFCACTSRAQTTKHCTGEHYSLFRHPPCWYKHGSTRSTRRTGRDVTSQVEFGLIATHCWQVCRKWSLTGCNGYRMLLLAWSPILCIPTSQPGSIFDPLLRVFWWFRDAGSAHLVHTGLLCGWPVSLELYQHVSSSGFLRRGSEGMELASTLTPGPCSEYRQLQIGAENSSFCGEKGRLAH